MAINYSYPRDLVLESSDLLSGIRASNNTTVNFTAKTLSNFLNTNSEVSIGGQLSFRFTVTENIAKTISFAGGGGNNTPFSSINELVVSATDLATSNVTVFLDYLVDSDILLSQQNQPNIFGHYKILSYTQIGITDFYTLELEFIGGSGNITDDTYYDISPLNLNQGGGGSQNFQQVIDTGNTLSDGAGSVMDMTATGMFFVNTADPGYPANAFVGFDGYQFLNYSGDAGLGTQFNIFQLYFTNGVYSTSLTSDALELQDGTYDTTFLADKTIVRDVVTNKLLFFSYPTSIVGTNKTVQWRDRGGNPAFTDEIPSLTGYATETWVGLNFYPLATNPAGYLTSAVTSVSATGPITSSGGNTPTISTSMNTNKLIGRSAAGTGVMEEITIGTGLTLTSGTLNATASGGGILHGTASGTDIYTVTITGPTSYTDGDAYLIRFPNGNTTSATLNINSLGAIPLYRNNDGVVLGGDIVAGAEMLCVYNSSTNRFQVIGVAPNTLIAYVTNDDSVTLTKGMPVYAFGGTGDRMTVKRANNTSDATSAQTVGLVYSTSIAANQKGLIMIQGLLDGLSILPTSTWNDGDPVYLGATAGTITNVKPYAPNHLVYLGVVTTASNGSAGRMYVRVQNGYELDELHNVQAQTPTVNDILYYFGGSPGQWKTASISTILGYTPQAQLGYTPYRYLNATQATYSGAVIGLAETAVAQTTILGGTFNSTDFMKMFFKITKPVTAFAVTTRIRVNTTNTLSGSTQIAIWNIPTTNTYSLMPRHINLFGGNGYSYNSASSLLSDIVATATVGTSFTYNTSSDLYVFFTIQLGSVADSVTFQLATISN